MSPWNEIRQRMEEKVDDILQSQAKQLDAIVSLREDLKKIHEYQLLKLKKMEDLERLLSKNEELRKGA